MPFREDLIDAVEEAMYVRTHPGSEWPKSAENEIPATGRGVTAADIYRADATVAVDFVKGAMIDLFSDEKSIGQDFPPPALMAPPVDDIPASKKPSWKSDRGL